MRRSSGVLLSLLISVFAQAQLSVSAPVPPAGKNLVTLNGVIASRNGDEVHGTLDAAIEPGWHIQSNKPLDPFLIATELKLDGADATSVEFPKHTLFKFQDQNLAVFEGKIAIPFVAKVKSGASSITATLRYQACNDSICLPPNKATTDIALANVSVAAPAATQTTTAKGFTTFAQAPADKSAPAPNDKLAAAYAEHGLPLTLLILFIGGLALNLTPCVFPMIPITVGFFAMQSDGRRSRRFALSVAYVLGIVVTYTALGVAAALSGKMFGSWLQSTKVLIGFAVLMLILASSMFGVWEFRVPQFIASRSAGRAGVAGALTMGLFVGIVAAPCVGPVVVALFTLVAAVGKVSIGAAMFATLAFGLGFPYLVALNALPKPGEWMVQVKKAMGFVLIAMAFYFLRAPIGEKYFRIGVAASLLIGAAFLFFTRGERGRVVRLICATLLLVAGIAFAIPPKKGAEVEWQKYDRALVATKGKPVIVDFYADWCIPCKEFDEKTFTDKPVAAELDRFVRVKANLTNDDDPTVQQLRKEYSIVGVPTLVFIDSTGKEIAALRLTGFEDAKPFLARLKRIQ